MSNLFSNTKNICTSILLLCIIFNYISLSEIKENFTLEKINAPYTKAITFKNNDEGNCISYSIVLEEEVENLENLYILFQQILKIINKYYIIPLSNVLQHQILKNIIINILIYL